MDAVQGTHMILNEVFKTTSTTRATGFLGGGYTLTGGDELAFNANFNIPNTTSLILAVRVELLQQLRQTSA